MKAGTRRCLYMDECFVLFCSVSFRVTCYGILYHDGPDRANSQSAILSMQCHINHPFGSPVEQHLGPAGAVHVIVTGHSAVTGR